MDIFKIFRKFDLLHVFIGIIVYIFLSFWVVNIVSHQKSLNVNFIVNLDQKPNSYERYVKVQLKINQTKTSTQSLEEDTTFSERPAKYINATLGQFGSVLPILQNSQNDRIVEQLKYKPNNSTTRTILLYDDRAESARHRLHTENCAVTNCEFISSPNWTDKYDAIMVKSKLPAQFKERRRPEQIVIFYNLEAPGHGGHAKFPINWTATYRRDATIVTPYEKFVPFSEQKQKEARKEFEGRNWLGSKRKMAAWFVSNCGTRNGREMYVAELRKYLDVDMYGRCGSLRCPRSYQGCFDMLKTDYKFYLAFENSNCKDYITEKLYWNAYKNDIIPVVMGAHPDDYNAVCPSNSYIHVDDFQSPAALAEYLQKVASDPDLYNSYFAWRGTGEFINTKFWCRLCSLVHGARDVSMWYSNYKSWWDYRNTCISKGPRGYASWRTTKVDFSYLNATFVVENHPPFP